MSSKIEDVIGAQSLEVFYDAMMEAYGSAPEIALFDPQLSGNLDQGWLAERAQVEEGISPELLERLLRDGLVRTFSDDKGNEGFILYSPHQAGVIHRLLISGRYSRDELAHYVDSWNDFLTAVVMDEPPYDDREVDDFTHFQRRVSEMVEFFENEISYPKVRRTAEPDKDEREIELLERRLLEWKRTARLVLGKSENELTQSIKDRNAKNQQNGRTCFPFADSGFQSKSGRN